MAVALTAAWAIALGTPNAWADSISPTDFDSLTLGGQVAADLHSDFRTSGGVDIGDLVGSVFFNSADAIYTYVFALTPGINNISEFNAGYDVLGFNGVAGYSFSETAAAGGGSFDIEHESDGTIDWEAVGRENGSAFFDSGETITFFFQSTIAPGAIDVYNLINHRAGGTDNYAPVPVPAAWPAGLVLLGALGAARRRWEIA